MDFAGRLAMELGCTLAGILAPDRCGEPMSAAEFCFWIDFRSRYGFVSDRLEWTGLNTGAAACQVQGAKVKASDLQAKFGSRTATDGKRLIAYLSSVKGAKVRKVPHGRK